MNPEQEKMAKSLPDDAGRDLNNYHIIINELCYSCADNYANIYMAFTTASKPDASAAQIYEIARARDLRILHETSKRLEAIPNIEGVAFAMSVHISHMNTLAGHSALYNMLRSRYGNGPIVDVAKKTVDHFINRNDFVLQWEAAQNASAIAPEEYQDESLLPQNTEYPVPKEP